MDMKPEARRHPILPSMTYSLVDLVTFMGGEDTLGAARNYAATVNKA